VTSPPKRKPLATPDPRTPKKAKSASTSKVYTSEDDAKFAAELHQVLNSTPVRKTRGGGGPNRSKPKSKVRSGKDGDNGVEKKERKKRAVNPNSPFNAPHLLSPQLAAVVGETELSRPVFLRADLVRLIACRLL
jgi:chromatin remodeling complex protein RSC6